jgi:hypothetical protein
MILGFTGTSHNGGMTQRQSDTVRYLFHELPLHVLHHGDCLGADAQAHRLARHMRAWVVVHPPRDPKARAFCKDYDELRPMFGYLTRNKHIVKAATDGSSPRRRISRCQRISVDKARGRQWATRGPRTATSGLCFRTAHFGRRNHDEHGHRGLHCGIRRCRRRSLSRA